MRLKISLALAVLLLITTAAAAQMEQKPMEPMDCKAMMQQRDQMQAKMKAMDDRLKGLVAEMNAARGSARTDKIAAVVNELVAQHLQMHDDMSAMMPQMMQHMMHHMQEGMMQGMKHSMADCPMMQSGHASPPSHP